MQENYGKPQYDQRFGGEKSGSRTGDISPLDLDADWSYLRANLDHPAHRLGNRFGSGLTEWLLRRLHSSTAPAPQLSILARIALGPRQTLALVEAEGVHLLVGTSAEGPPSFFALQQGCGTEADRGTSRTSERDSSRSDGAVAAPSLPNRGSLPGARTPVAMIAGRPAGRLRLTGRVSWV